MGNRDPHEEEESTELSTLHVCNSMLSDEFDYFSMSSWKSSHNNYMCILN